jgi:Spy/CpxP family protein refolding chaperone
MTLLAEGAAKRATRGRLWRLLLAVSLVLNVAFIGTSLWLRFTSPELATPEQRFEHIARELQLNDDQRDAFRQFAIEVRRGSRHLKESNQPLLKSVWEEMGKPQPDEAAVARLVEEATTNRQAYQKEMIPTLAKFLSTLTPEQRQRFIELSERRNDPIGWRLRRLITP